MRLWKARGRAALLVAASAACAAAPSYLTWQAYEQASAAGPATLDAALALVAGAAATLAAGWLVLAVAVSAVEALSAVDAMATLHSQTQLQQSSRAGRLAASVAPRALRRIVTLLVTATLLAPGAAQAATSAAGTGTTAPAVTTSSTATTVDTDPALAPSWVPGGAAGAAATPATPSKAPAATTPTPVDGSGDVIPALQPGWLPDPVATPPKTAAAVLPPAPALRPGTRHDDEVAVRRGDTLWDIAARHLGPGASQAQVLAAWPAWYDANRDVIGTDPDVIRPGQRLRIPPASDVPSTPTGAHS